MNERAYSSYATNTNLHGRRPKPVRLQTIERMDQLSRSQPDHFRLAGFSRTYRKTGTFDPCFSFSPNGLFGLFLGSWHAPAKAVTRAAWTAALVARRRSARGTSLVFRPARTAPAARRAGSARRLPRRSGYTRCGRTRMRQFCFVLVLAICYVPANRVGAAVWSV